MDLDILELSKYVIEQIELAEIGRLCQKEISIEKKEMAERVEVAFIRCILSMILFE